MKTKLIALSLILLGGVSLLATRPAEAFWPFSNTNDRADNSQTSLIDTLINKFNLDKDQVYETINQYRDQRFKQWQAYLEERLDQAVKDGRLTDTQKQAMLDKMVERFNEREEHMEEMHEFMEDNDLNPWELREYLGPGMGMGGLGRQGPGMSMMH